MNKGSIGKQASLVVLGDAITFSAALVSSMILARVISVEMMGTYRQVIYLGPMAVNLVELGVSASVYRYWNALDYPKRVCYVKMVVLAALVLGLSASVALGIMAPHLSQWYHNPDLKTALLVTAPYPLATIPLMLLRPALLSQGYSLHATSLETAFALVSVAALVIPLWLGLPLTPALAIWIAVMLLRLLAVPLILREYLRQPGTWWSRGLFSQVWDYLWPIQVGRIPGFVTGYLDKVAMSLFLTPQGFAVYSLGAREIPFVGVVGASVSSVLLPHLVEDVKTGNYEQICRRWRLACERTAMSTYMIGAFFIWYAVPVMQFMFSTTYTESSVPFRVFAALTFLRVIEYASLAKALGRSDLIMKSAMAGAGAMILLSIPMTWSLGGLGMALAVFCSTLTAAGYFLTRYRSVLGAALSTFFPWQRLALVLTLATLSTALGHLLLGARLALDQDPSVLALAWKLGILFVLTGVIYLGLLIGFGFIKPGKGLSFGILLGK
jgi:O-antigen/teichoic acid export membrane protein